MSRPLTDLVEAVNDIAQDYRSCFFVRLLSGPYAIEYITKDRQAEVLWDPAVFDDVDYDRFVWIVLSAIKEAECAPTKAFFARCDYRPADHPVCPCRQGRTVDGRR